MYWPKKQTDVQIPNQRVLQRTLSEKVYLGSSTVRCILINILFPVF